MSASWRWALGGVTAAAIVGLVVKGSTAARGASALPAATSTQGESEAEHRDAARLALAQAWYDAGRSQEARPILTDLSIRGATPSIRARASDILAQLTQ